MRLWTLRLVPFFAGLAVATLVAAGCSKSTPGTESQAAPAAEEHAHGGEAPAADPHAAHGQQHVANHVAGKDHHGGAAHGAKPHSHAAPHGGQVVDAGEGFHLEAVPHASGLLVYVLDDKEKTLPLAGTTASATLVLKDRKSSEKVDFHVMGDHLHAMTKLEGAWAAVVNVTHQGKALTARFEGTSAALAAKVRMEVTPTGGEVVAGKPAELVFRFFEEGGEAVKDFEVVHEKKLHTFVVSRDMAFFDHVHPELAADGSFKLTQVVPAPGDYRVFGDLTPTGKGNVVVYQDLKVGGGEAAAPSALVADAGTPKTVGAVKATLAEAALEVGKDTTLRFSMTDAASGAPVADLEPYLGAMGHLMVLYEDLETAVHAHPLEAKAAGHGAHGDHHGANTATGGSAPGVVEFHARFPKAGTYKMWAQFSRGGEVLTFPWVVTVR